jgi:hypothetical protein
MRGDSRDHWPDLNHVMREWIIEHQAGIPVLITPLSGHRRDGKEFGQVVSEHIAPWPTTFGTRYLVADSALYREANLQQFANTQLQWMTRVPATVSAAQAMLGQADPQMMTPLADGDRDHVVPSTSGGVEPRWVLMHSAPSHPHAQHTVHKPWLRQGDKEVYTCKTRCRPSFACEADAPQALATGVQRVRATFLHLAALRPIPRDDTRGRPGQGAFPAPVVDRIDGALASSIAAPQPLVNQQRCFILATNALDTIPLPPQEL